MTQNTPARSKSAHSFSLRLAGADEADERLENAIYGGGINDALLRTSEGKVFLDFDREADSFVAAVQSAIRDVERCADWLRIEAVEADQLTSESFSTEHRLAGV